MLFGSPKYSKGAFVSLTDKALTNCMERYELLYDKGFMYLGRERPYRIIHSNEVTGCYETIHGMCFITKEEAMGHLMELREDYERQNMDNLGTAITDL